jgi:delta 1-pyrroline-5-carboxylate dehydrogenase
MPRLAATATCSPISVRRLLENGANSSFVAAAADPKVPIESILKRPQAWIGDAAHARHPRIPLPRDLYRPARLNSTGRRVRRSRGAERARG